ncbi:403_t:CDS:1 [Acaulospora colombiana]|uniref:403_t:CDS:1 n=1 Tax=Acaulospora colombiana TaxID=27376 RepID=A0ACA9LLS4_9GLOM|nr:403_t:CDS:1 [Acaulospora colombiana]
MDYFSGNSETQDYFKNMDVEFLTDVPQVEDGENAPRQLNDFSIYLKHFSQIQKSKNGTKGNIFKLASKSWFSEPPNVKYSFKVLSEIYKRKHEEMYPGYKYSPRKSGRSKKRNPAGVSKKVNSSSTEATRDFRLYTDVDTINGLSQSTSNSSTLYNSSPDTGFTMNDSPSDTSFILNDSPPDIGLFPHLSSINCFPEKKSPSPFDSRRTPPIEVSHNISDDLNSLAFIPNSCDSPFGAGHDVPGPLSRGTPIGVSHNTSNDSNLFSSMDPLYGSPTSFAFPDLSLIGEYPLSPLDSTRTPSIKVSDDTSNDPLLDSTPLPATSFAFPDSYLIEHPERKLYYLPLVQDSSSSNLPLDGYYSENQLLPFISGFEYPFLYLEKESLIKVVTLVAKVLFEFEFISYEKCTQIFEFVFSNLEIACQIIAHALYLNDLVPQDYLLNPPKNIIFQFWLDLLEKPEGQ